MDLWSVVLSALAALFIIKAVLVGVRGGVEEARRRLTREQNDEQITAPARLLDERRRLAMPWQSSVFGLIGFGLLIAVVFRIGLPFFAAMPGRASDPDRPQPPAPQSELELTGPTGGLAPYPRLSDRVPPAGGTVRPPGDGSKEKRTADDSARIRGAGAKNRQRQAVVLGEAVLDAVIALRTEMDRWDTAVSVLMTDEKGKALSAQDHFIRRYRGIVGLKRPTREDAEEYASQAQALLGPLRAAYQDPLSIAQPGDDVTAQLKALLEKVHAAEDAYRRPRSQVEALLSYALSTGERGTKTLADAIRAQEEAERLAQAELVEAEEARAREEKAKAVAAARRAQVEAEQKNEVERVNAETEMKRLLGEQEVKRIMAEAEAARKKAEREQEERVMLARREHLRKRFELLWPSMRSAMTPFITPGYAQPKGVDSFGRTAVKGPVSLGRLRASGFLEPKVQALQNLHFATVTNGMNDRERGGFPAFEGTFASHQEELQRIQDFLREYGEVMVEKGLLAP